MRHNRQSARMEPDIEKAETETETRPSPPSLENTASSSSSPSEPSDQTSSTTTDSIQESKYQRWAASIRGLETRGIEPVPLNERQKDTGASTSLRMALMWFSMTLAINNVIVGSLGTLVLQLSFADAALCAVFGNLLGGLAVGYVSVWGPRSGHRTLVCLSSILPFSIYFGLAYGFLTW